MAQLTAKCAGTILKKVEDEIEKKQGELNEFREKLESHKCNVSEGMADDDSPTTLNEITAQIARKNFEIEQLLKKVAALSATINYRRYHPRKLIPKNLTAYSGVCSCGKEIPRDEMIKRLAPERCVECTKKINQKTRF